jgi:hypothetical protein
MNDKIGRHEPTPQFRAHLEWEMERTLRRGPKRDAVTRTTRWDRLRRAAVILLAAAVGALGSVVSAQVQLSGERGVLIAAEESHLALAVRRVEIAGEIAADTRQKFNVGVVARDVLIAAEAELQAMESAAARIRLNIDEIQATGRPPRDDLSAPLVGRRDFVTERLDLELAVAQRQLAATESATAEVEVSHSVGRVTDLPLLDARTRLAQSTAALELTIGKIDLRQRFLRQNLQPAEVTRQLQRLDLLYDLRSMEMLHELAEARLAFIRQRRDVGQADQVDLLRAELEAAERGVELEQIRRTLQLVEGSNQ